MAFGSTQTSFNSTFTVEEPAELAHLLMTPDGALQALRHILKCFQVEKETCVKAPRMYREGYPKSGHGFVAAVHLMPKENAENELASLQRHVW